MKRLGGSDSFTGSIIMRILLILLARISVGLEEKDITGKASGENNIQFFMPINNAKNSGFLNHVAQDWMGNQGHSVCSSEWHSSQRFVIFTKRKNKKNEFMLCILENIFKAIRGAVENGGEKSWSKQRV